MEEKVNEIKNAALEEISKADNLQILDEARVKYLGKKGELSNRKQAISALHDLEVVNKLFSDIAKRYENRNGGYIRIVKFGFRNGDAAPMAIIELVDRVDAISEENNK